MTFDQQRQADFAASATLKAKALNEKRKRAVSLLESGLSIREVAKELHVGRLLVTRWAKEGKQ